MDAKITKERLANFLAYEWLKIVIAVVAVVVALCVFFTTVRTRPRADQVFEIYAYSGLYLGTDGNAFSENAFKEKAFSYDVLEVTTEAFDVSGMYGSAIFTVRRASGQGNMLFLAPIPVKAEDGDGNTVQTTVLEQFVKENVYQVGETERLGGIVDFIEYTHGCEEYLAEIFGEDWRSSDVPSDEAVRASFLERNSKDKRFRTAAKVDAGVAQERERLIGLREDFLAVEGAIESGIFGYYRYTSESGNVYTVGLTVGGTEDGALKGLNLAPFVYYTTTLEDDRTVRTATGITVTIFDNARKMTNLNYDTFTFLRWMLKEYPKSLEE